MHKKKVTLISGAGRGIGKAIALEFAKNNQDLVLLVRKKSETLDLKKIAKKYNITAKIFVGDLRSSKFLKILEKKIIYVDNLINNAAMANTKFFLDVNDSDINNLLDVNLKAIFKLSQIFSKKMIKNKIQGNIVCLSSQLGHTGAYNRTLYCLTKFGLEGLIKALALDLAKFGIKVKGVCPTKTIVNSDELKKTPKRLNIIRNKIPLKKFSTVEQIAAIVFFLTTRAADSITGTSIISDGGWTAGK